MRHKSYQTTQRYIRYAELHQGEAHPARLPLSRQTGRTVPEQREDGGNQSGKPDLQAVVR